MCHKKNNSLNNCDIYDQLITLKLHDKLSSLLSKKLDIGGQN
jgi:hypothetical protein